MSLSSLIKSRPILDIPFLFLTFISGLRKWSFIPVLDRITLTLLVLDLVLFEVLLNVTFLFRLIFQSPCLSRPLYIDCFTKSNMWCGNGEYMYIFVNFAIMHFLSELVRIDMILLTGNYIKLVIIGPKWLCSALLICLLIIKLII